MTAAHTTIKPFSMSINDAAHHVGVSRDTIYRAAKLGLLTIHKVGKVRSVIRTEALEQWVVGGAQINPSDDSLGG